MYQELGNTTHQSYCDAYKALFGREPKYYPTEVFDQFLESPRKWVRNNRVNRSIPPVKEAGLKTLIIQEIVADE